MLIYFIRHGQTDWNHAQRFQGCLDIPLNDEGRNQADLLGQRLRGANIQKVYHSPQLRAKETASIVSSYANAPLTEIYDLHEISMGDWEGITAKQAAEQDPEYWQTYISDRKNLSAPNGESFVHLQSRVLDAIDQIVSNESSDVLAIVAHGAVLKVLFCTLLHIDLNYINTFDVSNASVNVVEYSKHRAKVITLNDLSHFPAPYDDLMANRAVL